MEGRLTHFDQKGNAVMVDVGSKDITERAATASGEIHVSQEIIAAVKRTSELIPMCHTLLIDKSKVDFEIEETRGIIKAVCTVKMHGRTGVEMEALTGVSVALLTIYDMCKAIDKAMVISEIHLETKTGGKSGDFVFPGTGEAGKEDINEGSARENN